MKGTHVSLTGSIIKCGALGESQKLNMCMKTQPKKRLQRHILKGKKRLQPKKRLEMSAIPIRIVMKGTHVSLTGSIIKCGALGESQKLNMCMKTQPKKRLQRHILKGKHFLEVTVSIIAIAGTHRAPVVTPTAKAINIFSTNANLLVAVEEQLLRSKLVVTTRGVEIKVLMKSLASHFGDDLQSKGCTT